ISLLKGVSLGGRGAVLDAVKPGGPPEPPHQGPSSTPTPPARNPVLPVTHGPSAPSAKAPDATDQSAGTPAPGTRVPTSIKDFIVEAHQALQKMFPDQGFSKRNLIPFMQFVESEFPRLQMRSLSIGLRLFYGAGLAPESQAAFDHWLVRIFPEAYQWDSGHLD